jgi:transcriptional regulator with XRE-family HTH domain
MQNHFRLAGLDISRSGASKIEARLSYVDDKTLLYLAEVLKVPVQELFPRGWGAASY